jgi:hypothetical protein
VRQLCERAQVGFDVGRKTASRMVARGDLAVIDLMPSTGPGRPAAVVVAADRATRAASRAASAAGGQLRSFWERPLEPDCT